MKKTNKQRVLLQSTPQRSLWGIAVFRAFAKPLAKLLAGVVLYRLDFQSVAIQGDVAGQFLTMFIAGDVPTRVCPIRMERTGRALERRGENEKTKDSRLAREFVVALPIELSEAQWKKLLSDFISDAFVADGMCADVAIHNPYTPGHNPHAHIMLTVRPLDEKGN